MYIVYIVHIYSTSTYHETLQILNNKNNHIIHNTKHYKYLHIHIYIVYKSISVYHTYVYNIKPHKPINTI